MRKVYYIFAILLLVSCALAGSAFAASPAAVAPRTVMIIPLDSRPVNTQYPELIARSAGLRVIMPPAGLLGDLSTDGDCEKIIAWAQENAYRADAFIVSVSMLAYGGLVGSRRPAQTRERALENIRFVEKLKRAHPIMPVFAFDSIQRLAVTAGSAEELEYYNLVRSWATLKDEVENFGAESKRAEFESVAKRIPPEMIEKYMATRGRNHEVNTAVIDMVERGVIDYLIIGQDDASKYGVHRAERERLVARIERLGLVNRVRVFSGIDEAASVLVARMAALLYGARPKACVEYFTEPGGESAIAEYEDVPLRENVVRHVIAAGGTTVERPELADVTILVSHNSGTGEVMADNVKRLAARASELIAAGRAVAIADLGGQKSERRLVDLLRRVVDVTRLSSYCAWNTAGNATGILIGHAFARACCFKSGLDPVAFRQSYVDSALAGYGFLFYRFLKDYSYKSRVKAEAAEFAKSIGADQLRLGKDLDRVSAFVSEKMSAEFDSWASLFAGKKASVMAPGALDGEIVRLRDFSVKLPWGRLFEAEIHFKIELKAAK